MTRDGILLVGHGTRDKEGTREFFELARVLARRVAPTPVEGCLLEFQHPTIPEAWQTLVDRGVKQVHVTPLLLFAAGHARQDIPGLVNDCAQSTPGVTYVQSGPLSRERNLIELLCRRIGETAERNHVQLDDGIGLVMVGRGSYDPCARSDMLILNEIVSYRLGTNQSTVGFYAMAEPKLPVVLEQMAKIDGIHTIIVQPHLLFQGRLYDAICNQVEKSAASNANIRFLVGDYLGPVEPIAAALQHRIALT